MLADVEKVFREMGDEVSFRMLGCLKICLVPKDMLVCLIVLKQI